MTAPLEGLPPTICHLSTAGNSVVAYAAADQVPAIIYWGHGLGTPSAETLRAMVDGDLAPTDLAGTDFGHLASLVPLAATGWAGRPGLQGFRPGGGAWSSSFHTVAVDADVADLCELAPAEGGVRVLAGSVGTLSYSLVDPDTELRLKLAVELLPQGFLRVRGHLTNAGETPYHLEEFSLAVPVPLEASEILDFAGRWARERLPQRLPVGVGSHLREGRKGRPGFDSPLVTFCGAPGFGFDHGDVWGVHVAHSGNYRTWVERVNTGHQILGGGELLLPGEVELAPGQSYETPALLFQFADGLDAAAHQLHRWQRSLPGHPDARRPVSLNVWEAVYFDHDLDKLTRLADRAAGIGVERFVLDDGWFLGRRNDHAGLGDWQVDPAVWPNGLHPLVDHVASLGMQFGLWVEPEMVNPDSELARAHPDWLLRARGELPIEMRHQQVLNLSLPEAWQHIFDALSALVSEYRLSYFKWDHNRDLVEAGNTHDGLRAAMHSQAEATYRLMDALRDAHPGLEIESCASGGGRVDLEMARHAQRFWVSDCIDPLERQSIVRWTSQLLTPETMGSHIASAKSHTTGRVSTTSFRAGTAIWGHLGLEIDLVPLDERELAELAEWIAFYKANRGLLLTGDVVRRDVADGSLWLHGVVAEDKESALFELTSRYRSGLSPRGRFRLPGLDPEREYRVAPRVVGAAPEGLVLPPWALGTGVTMSGAALASAGLHLPLIYPEQVLLLEVTAA